MGQVNLVRITGTHGHIGLGCRQCIWSTLNRGNGKTKGNAVVGSNHTTNGQRAESGNTGTGRLASASGNFTTGTRNARRDGGCHVVSAGNHVATQVVKSNHWNRGEGLAGWSIWSGPVHGHAHWVRAAQVVDTGVLNVGGQGRCSVCRHHADSNVLIAKTLNELDSGKGCLSGGGGSRNGSG